MKPSVEVLRGMRSEIETLGLAFGVTQVLVFGSVARGTAREESDVDLLVRMEAGRSLLDLIGYEQSLEALLGFPMDVIVEGGIHPQIEPQVSNEAVPL